MIKNKKRILKPAAKFFKKIDLRNVRRIGYLLLTVLVIGFLGYRFRDRFIAGVVNGEPIFRFQVTGRLNSLYGKTVLEDLIVEKLIYQNAKSKNISVSSADFSEAVKKLESQLGEGSSLDSVLALRGMDKSAFEQQLKLQLLVRKIMETEISITEEEISDFVKENKEEMTSTNEADLIVEAKNSLLEEKISSGINSWISGLLEKGKISRLLR